MKTADTITLDAIAAKAGVTKATVSNVLNRNRIGTRSDAVRNARRIRKIAAELGYRPNMAARAIQTQKFNAIGLIASTEPRRSVYQPYLHGLTRACRRKDLHLTLGEVVDEKLADERYVPKVLREWAVDGLLIAYMCEFPPQLAELIDQYRIPSVWINAKQDHDCVYPDDRGGMELGASRLLEMGHRRVAYFTPAPSATHYSATDRLAGFRHTMSEAGLTPIEVYPGISEHVRLPDSFDRLREMLSKPDRPTAFLCDGPESAMTLYHAATACGLAVPRDLSIIGVGSEHIVGVGRDIATLMLPTEEVGLRAVDMLTRKIKAPTEAIDPEAVPMTLTRFEASAAPPAESVGRGR